MKQLITCIAMLIHIQCIGQKLKFRSADISIDASFRGLSVANDSVAWVSGSKGWTGYTTDGGHSWTMRQVLGYTLCDFRSIYAIDAANVVIANAGSPAYILRTTDTGHTWQKVYENTDSAAFIDGIAFNNGKQGTAYGDPINGRLLLVQSSDKGRTWTEQPAQNSPLMSRGEASFAASGTCIHYVGRRTIIIATGGIVSRLLISHNRGRKWRAISTPIIQGTASTGIFSLLPLSKKHWIIAGGDYRNDTLRTNNLFITRNGGKTWIKPTTTTRGYRECVTKINGNLLATGPGGIDLSTDNGNTWKALSDEAQYHVLKKARKGKLTVIAGGKGKIARVTMED